MRDKSTLDLEASFLSSPTIFRSIFVRTASSYDSEPEPNIKHVNCSSIFSVSGFRFQSLSNSANACWNCGFFSSFFKGHTFPFPLKELVVFPGLIVEANTRRAAQWCSPSDWKLRDVDELPMLSGPYVGNFGPTRETCNGGRVSDVSTCRLFADLLAALYWRNS